VEVKKYADENLVGRPLIQKLQGAMLHYNANNGIFVTLGFYSKTAQQYGKEQGIWLINGDEFIDMTLKTNTTTIVTSPDTSTPSSTTLSMDLSLPGKPPNKGFGPKWEKSVRSAFNNCPLCNKQESIFLRMFGIRTKLICSNCNAEWTPIFGPFDHKLKHAKLVERGISPLGQTCVKKKMTPEQWNMISINYQIPHP